MSAELALLYLSLLKQDNYKELVDSTSFFELLGLKSDATKEEVESRYRFLKERMKPETFPEFSANRERFAYLIARIDQCYSNYTAGKSVIEKEHRSFEYVPISQMEHDFNPRNSVSHRNTSSYPLISEMKPEEFRPDPYISYVPEFDFISGAKNTTGEEAERVIIPDETEFDLISESPPTKIESLEKASLYYSDDIYTAGNDIAGSFISIPESKIDELSSVIVETVMDAALKGVMIRSDEMKSIISGVLKEYSSPKKSL